MGAAACLDRRESLVCPSFIADMMDVGAGALLRKLRCVLCSRGLDAAWQRGELDLS